MPAPLNPRAGDIGRGNRHHRTYVRNSAAAGPQHGACAEDRRRGVGGRETTVGTVRPHIHGMIAQRGLEAVRHGDQACEASGRFGEIATHGRAGRGKQRQGDLDTVARAQTGARQRDRKLQIAAAANTNARRRPSFTVIRSFARAAAVSVLFAPRMALTGVARGLYRISHVGMKTTSRAWEPAVRPSVF